MSRRSFFPKGGEENPVLEQLKLKVVSLSALIMLLSLSAVALAEELTFPQGTATPSETCGECHGAIYREYTLGIGSDNHSAHSQTKRVGNISMPAKVSSSGTAHASALCETVGSDNNNFHCNSCHFPDPFNLTDRGANPQVQPKTAAAANGGLTCASCHLTPQGYIRATHSTNAPHKTVTEPEMQSSTLCGHCHGYQTADKRVVGKMFQTYLEWQEDYYKTGLGKQQCQDCHMPRTFRKTAEEFEVPPRAVARHLWTGAHSRQRHLNSLSLTIVQPDEGKHLLDFQVTNVGAGHSVPTGEPSRAVFLRVEVLDKKGACRARKEWMFAPSYSNRPDDKAFLDEDKKRPDGAAASRADAQGPHESSIRAGEERVLPWEPVLTPGEYTVKARLLYSLDRYQDKPAAEDGSEITSATLAITAK
jgi:nitrate/TMAO reductase-like tetraheme cytochrome c subunit